MVSEESNSSVFNLEKLILRDLKLSLSIVRSIVVIIFCTSYTFFHSLVFENTSNTVLIKVSIPSGV